MAPTLHFRFLLLRDFSHIAFSCALEPLRIANFLAGQPLYRWTLASEDGHTAVCSSGVETLVSVGLEPARDLDRLFLISGLEVQRRATPALLAYLRRERAHGTALGAICSAAYVLARAGFLDGMEAAVHWAYHDIFAEEFPAVRLVRSVFVTEAPILSASGGTAAADLMLTLIARRHGRELATAVADQMVYNTVREGSAAQKVSLQARFGMRNQRLMRAVALMEANLEEPLTSTDLAEAAGVTPRQLERLFRHHLATTPGNYLTELRLDRAHTLLLQTEHSVTEIATACGFRSVSYFSRQFRARFGRAPSTLRPLPQPPAGTARTALPTWPDRGPALPGRSKPPGPVA